MKSIHERVLECTEFDVRKHELRGYPDRDLDEIVEEIFAEDTPRETRRRLCDAIEEYLHDYVDMRVQQKIEELKAAKS